MQPKVMLFDEPTSALDPELVGEVLEVMRDLASDGMTMIVVTHEMAFAEDVADVALIMDHGAIVEQGPPSPGPHRPPDPRARAFLRACWTAPPVTRAHGLTWRRRRGEGW